MFDKEKSILPRSTFTLVRSDVSSSFMIAVRDFFTMR